jgi:hypothetical protein
MITRPNIVDFANFILAKHGVESILEFGCGDGGIVANLSAQRRAGMDIWEPSLAECRLRNPGVETIIYDVRRAKDVIPRKSWDAVIGFDVLEHMTLLDATSVMTQAEQIATKAVLWWGPLEKTPRVFKENLNPTMIHVRCISIHEFEDRSYQIATFPNYWPDIDGFLAWKMIT